MEVNDFLSVGFTWFFGVVEDIQDPLEQGRVRVRCIGYHSEDLGAVATTDLPWATVLSPTNSAGISGIGNTPHALILGSWVMGFFRDGTNSQDPVIIGSMPSSYSELPNSKTGFSDPDEVYPVTQGSEDTYNDIHVNARSENIIEDQIDEKISNPASSYAATYPNNKVTQTTSGHIIEVDDTPGAERLKIYHKSGTFVEFHPDGGVTQANKNKWQITTGNDKLHVTGNVQIYVDGTATVTCPTTNWIGNINLDGNINITGTSTADVDHISNGISGHGHKHTDTAGHAAGITTAPNK